MDLIQVFSAEAFRYYFMSQCPFGGDGEFSWERFTEVYDSGLANTLGNTYSRTLSMAVRYFDGDLGPTSAVETNAWLGDLDLGALVNELRHLLGSFQYNVALQRIWSDVINSANLYIQTTKPFILVKTDRESTRAILLESAEAIRVVAILIKPFLPGTAKIFYEAFNFGEVVPWESVSYSSILDRPALTALKVTAPLESGKPVPLFPKIENKAV
jgi:methionyl-tRNA synthetase